MKRLEIILILIFSSALNARENDIQNIRKDNLGSDINSSDIMFQAWGEEWDSSTEIKSWFENWRKEVKSISLSESNRTTWIKTKLATIPGYVRDPTNLEIFEITQILKSNSENNRDVFLSLGAYLSKKDGSPEDFLWKPPHFPSSVKQTSNSTTHLAGDPDITERPDPNCEEKIKRLIKEIEILQKIIQEKDNDIKNLKIKIANLEEELKECKEDERE